MISKEKTFGEIQKLLARHGDPVVLANGTGGRVLVSPELQGRVLTSSFGGDEGPSCGWVNEALIASGASCPHIHAFGGEDRFWLGPEGGKYSLYFSEGAPFDYEHWQVPPALDTEGWRMTAQSSEKVNMRYGFSAENWSGVELDIALEREVRMLSETEIADLLEGGVKELSAVGFQSVNRVFNAGETPWNPEDAALSIWILGMFPASPETEIILPFRGGPEGVKQDYFGPIPAERLRLDKHSARLRGDAHFRAKIGLTPEVATGWLGSFSPERSRLTLVCHSRSETGARFGAAAWEYRENPFGGDEVNAYNDGPLTPGGGQLGAFYELESSSAAASLAPGESLTHTHTTLHLSGGADRLNDLARFCLGVNL